MSGIEDSSERRGMVDMLCDFEPAKSWVPGAFGQGDGRDRER
jgi:hypothetical protein